MMNIYAVVFHDLAFPTHSWPRECLIIGSLLYSNSFTSEFLCILPISILLEFRYFSNVLFSIFRLLSLKISRNHFIKIGWNWSYSFLSISEFLEIDDSATGFFCAICFWYRISSEQFQCLVSMQTFLKIVERWQTFSKNCCVVVFWISIFYLNLMSLSNCLSAVSSRDLKMEFGFSLSLWRLFVLPEENRA